MCFECFCAAEEKHLCVGTVTYLYVLNTPGYAGHPELLIWEVMDHRKAARQWRASSKARAQKIGLVLPVMPSIDDVEAHLKATGSTCCYCGCRFGAVKKTKMTMDHGLPISRGGGADLTNLRLCCYACNHAKGPLSEVEFLDLLTTVGRWADCGNSLLIRLRGGYWFYRGPVA